MINKKFLIPFSIAALSIILSFLHYPNYLSDDAFIHIGFINGLLKGDGFSFAGNRTYGTTSPLWVILGSVFSFVTRDPEISIRILSGFFTFLSISFFYFLISKLKLSEAIKIIVLLSLAINPFVLRWSLTGMEATAAMFLMIVFIILFQKEQSLKIQIYTGILFGISYLLRPEFGGFFLLTILYTIIKKNSDRKNLIFIFPALSIISAWLIFSYFHFGTILPNTYTAKSSALLLTFDISTLFRDVQTLFIVNLPDFIFSGIMVLYIISVLGKKRGNLFSNVLNAFKNQKVLLFLFWISVFYIFYILRDVTIVSRYELIFVPIIIFLVNILFETIINHKIKRFILFLTSTYVFLIIFSSAILTFNVIKPSVDDFVNGFQSTYMHIAQIINSYSKNQDVSVGVADVGIIGAYSNAKVYDSVGLVDNERFKYKSTLEYYLNKKPDFIILREEENIKDVIPVNVGYKILFSKKLPGFGIKEQEARTVTLYKINWK